MRTGIVILAALLFLAAPAQAQPVSPGNGGDRWYVSRAAGSNDYAGTREKPFRNIQKAIDVAAPGDVIFVAEGNYYGLQDCGVIHIDKGISILGGWSSDFSERNFLTHKTFIQPIASGQPAETQGSVQIAVKESGTLVELDGLILDRGFSVAYNPGNEGKPEGVETAMMQPIATAGTGAPGVAERSFYTAETAIVFIQTGSRCDVTIRNCAFVNGPNYGLFGSTYASTITVDNCVFVNIRMAAVELRGASPTANSTTRFTNNTVLFAWSRLKNLSDMGFGYRYLPKMDSWLDHDIFGCCVFSALDRSSVDSPASKEEERVTTCENSLFLLNRQADLTLPGGAMFQRVRAADFGGVAQLNAASGNREVTESVFNGAVNAAYLKGFVEMTGSTSSRTTMYANHYPVEDALLLFGAVEGYGAQRPE